MRCYKVTSAFTDDGSNIAAAITETREAETLPKSDEHWNRRTGITEFEDWFSTKEEAGEWIEIMLKI